MSEQIITIWDGGDCRKAATSKTTISLIEQARPQGAQLHARGPALSKFGPKITADLHRRFPDLRVYWGIAGDWDSPDIPGHSDGWEEAAIAGEASGIKALILNCEAHWRKLPKGSAAQAVKETQAAAPRLPLGHTSYGSVASFPDYPWREFCGPESAVDFTAPQIYWAREDGELKAFGYGVAWTERYARSIRAGIAKGWIRTGLPIYAYLQAYDCRTDELCACGEDYPATMWWTAPERLDLAGARAIASLAELHRRGKRISEFQRETGLKIDDRVGIQTMTALGVAGIKLA